MTQKDLIKAVVVLGVLALIFGGGLWTTLQDNAKKSADLQNCVSTLNTYNETVKGLQGQIDACNVDKNNLTAEISKTRSDLEQCKNATTTGTGIKDCTTLPVMLSIWPGGPQISIGWAAILFSIMLGASFYLFKIQVGGTWGKAIGGIMFLTSTVYLLMALVNLWKVLF